MQNVNRKFRIWGVLLLLMFFAAGVFRYSAANVQAATQTGFVTINGKSYYINKDGSKQKGWLELDGKKYYFNASTGVQVKGPDGSQIPRIRRDILIRPQVLCRPSG